MKNHATQSLLVATVLLTTQSTQVLGDDNDPYLFPATIQGTSSKTSKKMCWEVRGGKYEVGNKIILGECKEGEGK
eukprot:CAMPEP_0113583690 /NCGR_PEP_ID=MMETSP0015_2-20120614/32665_1 /TAXON_ID=2838 /ORGANISM="Odontella" /LENGTH=74 /DNA_ID=CAMNT_0000488611 /DNA_START=123 /DNA_END=344 /DNA_ORIENTATION=+ /assembly_acc=CAM_ASM_000160